MTTKPTKYQMLPYRHLREIDYASLEFDPGVSAEKPDGMRQHLEQWEVLGLLISWFTDFNQRPDVFVDFDSFICYDPTNNNVRISPDIYVAFGVDTGAIRPRMIYLPDEVGKPPDWVLEIASESTWREDVNRKPAIYARIGVPEYWRFDPSGGDYYGYPLAGDRLAGGAYEPIELTTEPDGILKGYSEVLGLSFCWDDGWPRFYDPASGTYLENWQRTSAARAKAEAQRDAAEARAAEAEAELRQLREQLRRLGPG
jgi:Uma2 family endonuclease